MTFSESYIFKLASIIVKSFREDLTGEEQQLLEDWLNASEKNKCLYLQMQEESWLEEKMREALLINYESDYVAFINHRKRAQGKYFRKLIFKYVAITVLLLSAGVTLWYVKHVEQLQPVVAQSDSPSVKREVVLTLGNGKQVVLNETDSIVGKEQSGTFPNITGKVLSYRQVQDSTPKTIEYNTLFVPRGGEYYLILSDGTGIWLNSESRLRYPVVFSGGKREVYLEGEAFFDVAKNEKMPFVVIAGDTRTEVLGTEFNLRAYANEAVVSTTLVEGSVRLYDTKKSQNVTLLPGEQGNVVKANGLVSKHSVDTYLYTAWKDGRLVFRNCRMEELLEVLARWYDVELFFMNSELRDMRFTGDMCKTEHIDALLKIIENNGLVVFERKGKTLTVKAK